MLMEKQHHQVSSLQIFSRRILTLALYIILPIAVFRMYFYRVTEPQSPVLHQSQLMNKDANEAKEITVCNYSVGKWIHSTLTPLYNETSCGTIIKEGRNCQSNGRTDIDYLNWKWKPDHCDLPTFNPILFLNLMKNKHLAFIGDSLARNQLESLLCMLSTFSTPQLVYTDGVDNKFRRWYLVSHNVTISGYWSPFLVTGVEKSSTGVDHNVLHLDSVNERWAKDLWEIDAVVLSVGHWFLLPAVYYEGDTVLGCHYCPGLNHTEIGFYDMYRKAVRTALRSVIIGRGGNKSHVIDMFLTSFTPAHFEGEWDNPKACSRTQPYKVSDKITLDGMNAEMRRVELEEVEACQKMIKLNQFNGVSLKILDVTLLALLRPDGHPGRYMNPFPNVDGSEEHVQNDCVHWCLPGPIDTWNEILLDVMKRSV